jgi:hypothetical protein
MTFFTQRPTQLFVLAALPLMLVELAIVSPARAMDSEDLYRLCSSFPYNSQCNGYEAPIALAQRDGQAAGCLIKTATAEIKAACKIQIAADTITLYHEFGDGLSVLKNEKASRSLTIPTQSVSSIQYREDKKLTAGSAIASTLLLGLPGLLLAPKKKYSEVSINYVTTASADSPNHVVMVFDRKTGLDIRFQLEKATGKGVETPEQTPKAAAPSVVKPMETPPAENTKPAK